MSTPRATRLDPQHIRDFGARLRAWYRRNARDLPWRRTRDPYHILVSELMLQQTQVARVLEFYPRFLRRFPTITSLASARESQVVAEWAGLGYYARARNLHRLARDVTRDEARGGWDLAKQSAGATGLRNGRSTTRTAGEASAGVVAADAPMLPAEPDVLRRLPGVGAYTAGAVSSFAFERRAALVDTNVARVLTRAFAPHLQPKRARDWKRLWAIAEAILPRTGRATWTHNQALMELGALVCTARIKRCAECPVRSHCATVARTTRRLPRTTSG